MIDHSFASVELLYASQMLYTNLYCLVS